MEIPKSLFERVLDEIKEGKGVHFDTELTAEDLKEVIVRFKKIYQERMGEEFPQEPRVQLMEAVKAVFRSWDNERAIVYRRMNAFRAIGGRLSTYSRWYLEIWAIRPARALPLPATLPLVRRGFSGNI